jgi:hypothetical protein
MNGTSAMRKACERRLPKWPAEESDSYVFRLRTATLFPAYQRTVSVLTGKPFSKPVTPSEDMPARIEAWLADVDQEGRNLDAFAADLCMEALAYGMCGILVDAESGPTSSTSSMTRSSAGGRNSRPGRRS